MEVLALHQRVSCDCTCRSPGFNLPVWPQKSSWAMVPSKTYVTCRKTNIETVKTDTSSFNKVSHSKTVHFYCFTQVRVCNKSFEKLGGQTGQEGPRGPEVKGEHLPDGGKSQAPEVSCL